MKGCLECIGLAVGLRDDAQSNYFDVNPVAVMQYSGEAMRRCGRRTFGHLTRRSRTFHTTGVEVPKGIDSIAQNIQDL